MTRARAMRHANAVMTMQQRLKQPGQRLAAADFVAHLLARLFVQLSKRVH
jgi:hypothetical protein